MLKIQYPEAERLVTADLASLRLVTGLVARAFGWVVFRDLVEEVAQFIRLELDFAREAASTERIGGRFADSACVRVPHVHRGLSTRKLLVLEYLDGIQITDVDRLRAAGLDLAAIAERVATMYVTMIFEHGFFHGDPHPGNLLVLGDGSIGLLDFGLAKELPPGFAAGVADLLVKGVAGDARGAAAAARAIGFEIDDRGADAMAALVRILMGARHDVSALRDALGASPIARAPSHFALVIRTLILLNGLSERLAPGQQLIARAVLRALVPLSQVLVPAPRTGQMRAAI